jgi:hypothetical protein
VQFKTSGHIQLKKYDIKKFVERSKRLKPPIPERKVEVGNDG